MSFDKSNEYNSEIKAKVRELRILCNRAKIPMFFAACPKDEGESQYIIEMLSPALCDVKLTNDLFYKFVNVTNGFDTVVSAKNSEICTDDLLD